MWIEIAIVLVLILINGLLAMSELAIVSARPARMKVLAERGDHGAAIALRLAEDPGRFLSSVQIGITLVGVLSGAFRAPRWARGWRRRCPVGGCPRRWHSRWAWAAWSWPSPICR